MMGLLAVALFGVGGPTAGEDRICHMTAVQLGSILAKADAPPNWYSLSASASTDNQGVDRQISIKAIVSYSYVDADGESMQGQSIVILKGDGAAGSATVALSGSFSAPASHGQLSAPKVETSLCLIDIQ